MKINVGFLVAYDYDLLRISIPSVYEHADKIVLALDINLNTWSGNKFDVDDSFFKWIKEFDKDSKIEVFKEDFYIASNTAMQNETRERNLLASKMGEGYCLQLDADEFVLDFKSLTEYLKKNESKISNNKIQICGYLTDIYKKVDGGYLFVNDVSSFYLGFMRNLSACCGNIGLFSERCFFALRTPVHSSLLLFRPVSGFVSSLANNISKGCCATFYSKVPAYSRKSDTSKEGSNNPFLGSIINVVKSIFSGDKLPNDPPRNINADSDGFSDFILSHIGSGCQLDDVVDCSLFSFSGHVYNLENKDNWYTSNDIITHNCRSQYLAIVIGEDDLEGRRTAVGGRKGESAKDAYELRKERKRIDGKVKRRGRKDDTFFDPSQVNAKTNYQKWFLRQPIWWQESAIGKTRASLVRNGGMKISKFNDMTGRQLSLDELRALDAKAFAKAGL